MPDPVIGQWYRASYFEGQQRREFVGTYKGLMSWADLPDHKYGGTPAPDAGEDEPLHWFYDDQHAVGIAPDNLDDYSLEWRGDDQY